jgi:hypothetical protein
MIRPAILMRMAWRSQLIIEWECWEKKEVRTGRAIAGGPIHIVSGEPIHIVVGLYRIGKGGLLSVGYNHTVQRLLPEKKSTYRWDLCLQKLDTSQAW